MGVGGLRSVWFVLFGWDAQVELCETLGVDKSVNLGVIFPFLTVKAMTELERSRNLAANMAIVHHRESVSHVVASFVSPSHQLEPVTARRR